MRDSKQWLAGILLSWVAVYSLPACAQTAAGTKPAVAQHPVMRPVSLTLPGMDAVQVTTNLAYSSVDDPLLKMDVYLPAGSRPGEHLPTVIFIHGATDTKNTPKEWGVFQSWARLVAASGMAAVTFNYSSGFPHTRLVEGRRDVKSAMAYLKRNADVLRVDPNRLVLVAYSAGGPLLSLPFLEHMPGVRAIAGFYPVLDIRDSEAHRASESAETLRDMSVLAQMEAHPERALPFFIARAGREQIPGLNTVLAQFVQASLARNLDVTIVNHANGVHGFDNLNDDDRSREIVAMALAFFKAHLR